MDETVIEMGAGFWNLRGSFRIMGVLDVGTQVSLLRRRSGGFVFLDSYTLDGETKRRVMELTGNGTKVEAILNLHPFHTLHVAAMHRDFPAAKLYGTRRHVERAPSLPWESPRTDSAELHALFADDLEFSVPRGVDFISSNENVHFSSVLAYHPATRTIHSDDTLTYLKAPGLLRLLIPQRLGFHPTLAKALEKRKGAAADFRAWAKELSSRWHDAENLCAAHNQVLRAGKAGGPPLSRQIEAALARVAAKLDAHEKTYG
jgi:hypothetical protein